MLIQSEDETGCTTSNCVLLGTAAVVLEAFPAFKYKLQMLGKAKTLILDELTKRQNLYLLNYLK